MSVVSGALLRNQALVASLPEPVPVSALPGDDPSRWPEPAYVLNCSNCGRFMTRGTWANIYDFVAMEPSHEVERCPRCTENLGPALSNARPYNGDMRQYEGIIERGQYKYGRPDHPENLCPDCGGHGEYFGHADDCDNDSCALNGDIDSCNGQVFACHCAQGMSTRSAETEGLSPKDASPVGSADAPKAKTPNPRDDGEK